MEQSSGSKGTSAVAREATSVHQGDRLAGAQDTGAGQDGQAVWRPEGTADVFVYVFTVGQAGGRAKPWGQGRRLGK